MSHIAPPRPFDHLVVAVRDLDAAAALYRRLGFRVGPRNVHPWGTENHIIQFDGAFLELISTGDRFDAASGGVFARDVSRHLAQREGAAMLVLRSTDAGADAEAFSEAGVGRGRFRFARQGMGADGGAVEVAFSLAFAGTPLVDDASFFVCEQTHPERFWNRAAQTHDNGARRLNAVTMQAGDPSDLAEFLSAFTRQREMLATSLGLELTLAPGQRLEVLTPAALAFRYGAGVAQDGARIAAFRVGVADPGRLAAKLAAAGVRTLARNGMLVVPASEAMGVAIAFEPGEA
jgi:catechol 2,3-dioxygenase-like lactoylglutathione lyase family enzyme